jgi:hypothetical protein
MTYVTKVPRWALFLIAAASLCVIAASGFRLATRASATSDPFQGISAAENAPVVPANSPVIAQMESPSGGVVFDQTIHGVRQLPSKIASHTAYVVPTTNGDFCLFAEQLPEACDSPLSAAHPLLFIAGDPDGSGPIGTTAFGIAEDDVASVTMTVNGNPETVSVQGNVFAYSGGTSVTPSSVTSITANFGDGHSVALLGPTTP